MDVEGVGSGLMRGAKMGATLEVLPIPVWVAFGACAGLRIEVEDVRVLAFGRVQLLSRCSLMSSADTRSSHTGLGDGSFSVKLRAQPIGSHQLTIKISVPRPPSEVVPRTRSLPLGRHECQLRSASTTRCVTRRKRACHIVAPSRARGSITVEVEL